VLPVLRNEEAMPYLSATHQKCKYKNSDSSFRIFENPFKKQITLKKKISNWINPDFYVSHSPFEKILCNLKKKYMSPHKEKDKTFEFKTLQLKKKSSLKKIISESNNIGFLTIVFGYKNNQTK
jgi:hypothetical protein